MLTKTTVLLLIGTIFLLAVGQVFFKSAAGLLEFSRPKSFLTWQLVTALVIYVFATLAWLYVLSCVPLTVAFPFYGLSFLFVPILAWLVFGEPLRWEIFAGGVLIFAGIMVSIRGL